MPSIAQGHTKALLIGVGGVSLKLLGMDARLAERARARYAAFETAEYAGFPVEITQGIGVELPGPTSAFRYQVAGASLVLDGHGARVSSVRNEYALDSVLRVLLTRLLLPSPGFLLHAATVVQDGKGYVFMGRSGAGKSTVASLSPRGSVLTDEISLLRRIEGTWYAHGTPFWGEFRAAGQNRRVPLERVFALVQAGSNRTAPLATRQALAGLLGNTLFFSDERAEREELLRAQMSLIESAPVERLEFRRDETFWEVAA
jgi:hypothetical protein